MNPRNQSKLDEMFDYQTVYYAYTALIAGLITSAHCVAMCGPLSCAFTPTKTNYSNPQLGTNRGACGGLASTHYLGYRGSRRLGLPPFLADSF
ncbi:MAG: hypothetical protein CML15_03940 [Puniceicoccaceae bacterium]|nr:hypothetical protein [Puniceicoccaceae bacterium]